MGVGALAAPVVLQFVTDHVALPDHRDTPGLPAALDTVLVQSRIKARPGALALNTVEQRLAVLASWHRLQGWPSPTESSALKALLNSARKAQARAGTMVRKKTAVAAEPLAAMLATCTDGLRGSRDRALLLLGWSGGGRRRSELVGLRVEDLRELDAATWLYRVGNTKTDSAGLKREKPLRGEAAVALQAWLDQSRITSGPLFRRLHRGGHVGKAALSADHVARMVKRRAEPAGLTGDWAAHSLRAGYVTEAGRQGVPLGDVMAMTEHRSVGTVMGYFQSGSLLASPASALQLPTSVQDRAPDY